LEERKESWLLDKLLPMYSSLFDTGRVVSACLFYCVRGPRIKETTVYNYKMFYQGLFQGEIPIVLVVTGLEQEDPMDAWWRRNGDVFRDRA